MYTVVVPVKMVKTSFAGVQFQAIASMSASKRSLMIGWMPRCAPDPRPAALLCYCTVPVRVCINSSSSHRIGDGVDRKLMKGALPAPTDFVTSCTQQDTTACGCQYWYLLTRCPISHTRYTLFMQVTTKGGM